MTVQTTAGSTLAIAADAPATFDAAGFGALTFTTIGEITNFGEHGREYALVTHNPASTRGTQKYKGSFDSGAKDTSLAIDKDDAGQIIAEGAVLSDDDYSFVETWQDGAKEYFRGKVMSFKTQAGGVDDIRSGTIMVQITTDKDGNDFVFVPAA